MEPAFECASAFRTGTPAPPSSSAAYKTRTLLEPLPSPPQAWGAGKERRLPVLLQRTVLFLWLHCIAISGAMMLLPLGLQALGQDPALSRMVRTYLVALLPAVWLEALSR